MTFCIAGLWQVVPLILASKTRGDADTELIFGLILIHILSIAQPQLHCFIPGASKNVRISEVS